MAEAREKKKIEVSKVAEEAIKVFGAFTPGVARGIIILAITIPTVALVSSAIGAIFPALSIALSEMIPILVQMIMLFMFFSIMALTIGVVRRLV